MIVAYKLWSSEELVKEKGIEELLRIYVKFNTESEKNEDLILEARQWFVKMEQNDPERWKSGIGLKKSVWLSLNVSMIYLEYPLILIW